MRFNSIRFKITVFYTAILGMILVLYTAVLYYNLNYALYREFDNNLMVKAQEVSNAVNSYLDSLGYNQRAFEFAINRVIRQEGEHPAQEKVVELERAWLAKREKLDLKNAYIDLASISRGQAIVNSHNMDSALLTHFLKDVSLLPKKALSYKNVDLGAHRLRMVNIPFYFKNKRMYLIQVGASRKPVFTILSGRLIFASLAIPFILLIASFLGGVITNRILKPVMEVAEAAGNITHKDLSVRVKASHVDEELKYLVDAFNEMISRLDKSFRYIAEFSSNVAHELRTPLTVIRGESEVTLMQERDSAEYQRALKVNMEETDGMLKIVEDLLLLSRLEYQPQAFHFETFDFSAFMREVFQQAGKMASQKNISMELVSLDKPLRISADASHVRRLFFNLLHNAVKFTPSGGSIIVKVQEESRKLKVAVADTGPGIRPQDQDKIFDRFFRADRSSSPGEDGSGLGLSIAQSIARIHRGNISVKSQPHKGATFTVTLPL